MSLQVQNLTLSYLNMPIRFGHHYTTSGVYNSASPKGENIKRGERPHYFWKGEKMDYRRTSIWALIVFLVVALAAFLFIRWLGNQNYSNPSNQITSQTEQVLFTPTVVFTPQPTITPTPGLPASDWKFTGFNGEKTYANGYEYSWGIFENDNGLKIKAMCSAPESPAPNVGDYYSWDKQTNILIPVQDNQYGNMQRFWYPTVQ